MNKLTCGANDFALEPGKVLSHAQSFFREKMAGREKPGRIEATSRQPPLPPPTGQLRGFFLKDKKYAV